MLDLFALELQVNVNKVFPEESCCWIAHESMIESNCSSNQELLDALRLLLPNIGTVRPHQTSTASCGLNPGPRLAITYIELHVHHVSLSPRSAI